MCGVFISGSVSYFLSLVIESLTEVVIFILLVELLIVELSFIALNIEFSRDNKLDVRSKKLQNIFVLKTRGVVYFKTS